MAASPPRAGSSLRDRTAGSNSPRSPPQVPSPRLPDEEEEDPGPSPLPDGLVIQVPKRRPTLVLESPPATPRTQAHRVLEEILKTEEQYYNDLNVITNELLPSAPVSAADSEILFCNIRELADLHAAVLAAFKLESRKPQQVQNWGGILLLYNNEFRSLYQRYTKNQKSVRILRMRLMKEDAAFKKWADEKQLVLRQDLNSFLIKPVQRICKYPLLLRELEKSFDLLEVSNDASKRDLEIAMAEMSDCLTEANDFMMTVRGKK
jgi:cell division control protein 24